MAKDKNQRPAGFKPAGRFFKAFLATNFADLRGFFFFKPQTIVIFVALFYKSILLLHSWLNFLAGQHLNHVWWRCDKQVTAKAKQ